MYASTINTLPNYITSKGAAGFQQDLDRAHQKENNLKQYLEEHFDCTVNTSQDKGSFSDYDVKIFFTDFKIERTFEVKQDKKTQHTRNIAVEYQRTLASGEIRPTCISISKADVWAYWVGNTFWLIDTSDLRKMISDKLYKAVLSGAGEGNRASIYLFDKDVFFKHATNITNYL